MNEVESVIMMGNLFSENTTVLNYLEENGDIKGKILEKLHSKGAIESSNYPLINQAVFLSAAYISFVWLYEYFAKKNEKIDSLLASCLENIERFDEICVNQIEEGRNTKDIKQFLRTIRNSISHASVFLDFKTKEFIFSDQYSKNSSDHAKLVIPMNKVGELSEKLLCAYNKIARNELSRHPC